MKNNLAFLFAIACSLTLQAQSPPTAREITERYIAVSGDFSNITSTRALITSEPFNGIVVDIEIIKDASHRLRQSVVVYDSSRIVKLHEAITIYNKGKAVKVENGKKEDITDLKQLDEMHLNSFFFSEYAYRSDSYQLEVAGLETIDGVDHYRVNITTPNGFTFSNYYEKERGYLTYINTDVMKSHLTDYQQVEGRYYPMTTYGETNQGVFMVLKVKSISINENLKPDLFKL